MPIRFGIRVAHLDHLARRGFDALEHVAVRVAGAEVDVGQHRQVAAADRFHRRAAHAGQVRRRVVAVQVLRVLLVEGHQHRPLLARLVVVGQREDALQPDAVLVLVVEQDAAAPQVVLLLRVGIGDLLRVGEARARDAQVRELDERLAREQEPVGLRRLLGRAERRVLVDELLQLAVLRARRSRTSWSTARTRVSVSGFERSIVPRGPTARGTVRSTGSSAHVAEADLVLRADAVGQVLRRRAVERQQPQVVAVLRDRRLAVAGEAGDAVGRLGAGMVVFGVDEADRRAVAERSSPSPAVEVVGLEAVVLPVEERACRAARCRRMWPPTSCPLTISVRSPVEVLTR